MSDFHDVHHSDDHFTVLQFLEDYDLDMNAERQGRTPAWESHDKGAEELLSRLAGGERTEPADPDLGDFPDYIKDVITILAQELAADLYGRANKEESDEITGTEAYISSVDVVRDALQERGIFVHI